MVKIDDNLWLLLTAFEATGAVAATNQSDLKIKLSDQDNLVTLIFTRIFNSLVFSFRPKIHTFNFFSGIKLVDLLLTILHGAEPRWIALRAVRSTKRIPR